MQCGPCHASIPLFIPNDFENNQHREVTDAVQLRACIDLILVKWLAQNWS
jgi:hypothetical protein